MMCSTVLSNCSQSLCLLSVSVCNIFIIWQAPRRYTLPEFLESHHMKVVRSVLCTGCIYPPPKRYTPPTNGALPFSFSI
jgi:hypothetical protein